MAVDQIERTACVAHDLRSPLNTIQVLVGALRMKLDDLPNLVGTLAMIERNISYMDRVLCDLVDLSCAEHGEVELRRERVDVVALLAGMRERLIDDSSRLRFALPAGPIEMSIDPVRIERVLANLIENALKYGPRDVPVVVRLEHRDAKVRIAVTDGGPSLAPRDAALVFERHRRLDSRARHDGSGLGLYLSRRIVEAHGGTIGVDAAAGSCFFIELHA